MNSTDNIPQFGFDDFRRYTAGEMTPAEMHALETASLDDPFLADALDGYMESNNTIAATHLTQIKNTILGDEQQEVKIIAIAKTNSRSWLRVAAMIVLMCGAAFISYKLLNKSTPETVLSENTIKKQEQVSTPQTDSISNTGVPGNGIAIEKSTQEAEDKPIKNKVNISSNNKRTFSNANATNNYTVTVPNADTKFYNFQADSVAVAAAPVALNQQKDFSYSKKKVAEITLSSTRQAKTASKQLPESLHDKVLAMEEPKEDAAKSISIRGIRSAGSTTAPLYVVNGLPVDTLTRINPENIKDITALKKDAASALYGPQGANGAILITTNKPELDKNNNTLGDVAVTAMLQKSRAQNGLNGYTNQYRGNTMRGRVISSNNQPLANAIVQDDASRKMAVTDRNGYFELDTNDSSVNASVTYNGYDLTNVQLQRGEDRNITLNENSRRRDEVVVVGYANSSKAVLAIKKNKAEPAQGWEAYKVYITQKIKYYNDTASMHVFGKVQLQFLIDDSGKPYSVSVLSGDKILRNAAVLFIKDGPLWITDKNKKQGRIQIEFAPY